LRRPAADTRGPGPDPPAPTRPRRLPGDAVWAERWAVRQLRRAGCPDLALIWLMAPRWRGWLALAAWGAGVPLAERGGVLNVYVMLSIVALMLYNLGTRQPGEASAYSVFNNHEALAGQLTGEDFDRAYRGR